MKTRQQTNLAESPRRIAAGPHLAALSSPRTIIRPNMLRKAGRRKTTPTHAVAPYVVRELPATGELAISAGLSPNAGQGTSPARTLCLPAAQV
ncbi:MAG: hypothetical protein H6Q33_3058 [Deltaproteobacteria bacterium]|nr:hypothetical protein [Deltaproteobacteria bacterium]